MLADVREVESDSALASVASSLSERRGCEFPKSVRITKRADFLSVQRAGPRLHTKSFVIAYRSGTGRIGFTVSKKVGNAVVRNRVKRYLREFARHSRWPPCRFDVVLIAKREAKELRSQIAVENDLCKAKKRLEAL